MNKKEEERLYLDKFLLNKGIIPINTFHLPNDPPDFIIDYNGEKVSIEITQLINKEQKKRESQLNRIKNKLLERLNNEFPNKGIRLTFTFNGYSSIPKIRPIKEKEGLNALWEELNLLNNFNKDETKIHLINQQPFALFFFQVKIDENYNDKLNNIEVPHAYKVPDIEIEQLNKLITKKSNGIIRYQTESQNKWLLIISNIFSKSSAFGFDTETLVIEPNGFDKIFIYRYDRNEIIEL